ncbi:hypothetical protein BJV77DRAFT_1070169 [Russula vinacea]|nr:hypothetical protein BJV77DRAFT_1070169 [Russula vinacea]
MSQLPSSQSSLHSAIARSSYEWVRDQLRDLTTVLLEVVDVSIAHNWAEELGNIVRKVEPLGMTVGSCLWVEAMYLNAVQAASRVGIRFFATNEWVTLTPELLMDSLMLAEGLDEGVTLGGAFPSTFPSLTTLAFEELASPDFPPVSPAFPKGPSPTPTPVPMLAPMISR